MSIGELREIMEHELNEYEVQLNHFIDDFLNNFQSGELAKKEVINLLIEHLQGIANAALKKKKSLLNNNKIVH